MTNRKTIPRDVGLALWARAAGRCELCGKELDISHAFDVLGNYAQVAHINACSPKGPRYNSEMTPEERDGIENLMLLCYEHHKMIDSNPDRFPEEMLRKRKFIVEESIAGFVASLSPSETITTILALPIGGMRSHITPSEVSDALRSEGLFAAHPKPFDFSKAIGDETDLQGAASDLERSMARFGCMWDNQTTPVSVFGLAPQPLLIKLGSLLGGTRDIRIFQPNRSGIGWEWPEDGQPVDFQTRQIRASLPDSSCAVVMLNLSGIINTSSIVDLPDNAPVFELTTPDPRIDIVSHRDTIGAFCKESTSLIDHIHESYPDVSELHVYPAMPVSLALALGTALRFNLIGNYVIHEKADGTFGETLNIRRYDG